MARLYLLMYLAVLIFVTDCFEATLADTDTLDVEAIRDLYKALNNSQQLIGWKSDGGDPCGESWTGISCFQSSVIYIDLHGLNLTGYLGGQLSNLHNLKQLDVSSNNILGEIPYSLPPNATHINLACNKLTQNIPATLTSLINLRHLNLSNNLFYGPIGNVFTGLQNMIEMDLSHNNFTGDLPSSFGSLMNLNKLFLQENKFSGSVIFLADLPLIDLNIQDNHFSGVIPKHFQTIQHLWIGGNKFHVGGSYPEWDYPLIPHPNEQSILSPPTTESSAIANYPSFKADRHKKRKIGPAGVAVLVGGGTLLVSCAALILVIHINRARAQNLRNLDSSDSSPYSPPMSIARDFASVTMQESPRRCTLTPPPMMTPRKILPARHERMSRRSFSKKNRIPGCVKLYTVAELQSATNSFSEQNFLGEGSLGSVYKADFPDGQIMAVKNINTVALSLHEEEQFLEVIWNASRFKHPNIVPLVGYCVEHGQHLLVHEYVGNVTLDDALHCEAYKPFSWGHRLRIALGIARALEYLHSTFSPPVAHSNLKAANILLDEKLMPCVCDCGLAVLRSLTSNSVKLKASEMAIGNAGYIAPEHGQSGIDSTKSDIYAFGVLLLEILTGNRPLDSSKPREEQSLVKWASLRLHDSESLEKLVDSRIKKTVSAISLSRFADVVSLCIQAEKEYRPAMSEIVESLMCLIQKPGKVKRNPEDGTELDPFERSFRSTNSRFMGSPAMTFFSV